jgi:hypothetical protein
MDIRESLRVGDSRPGKGVDKHTPWHARHPRKRHQAAEPEVFNTVLAALSTLFSALSAFAALWAIIAPPNGQTVAPAQPAVIVCYDGHASEHCQVVEVQSTSP